MTTEEKRRKLEQFCMSKVGCYECVLEGRTDSCGGCYSACVPNNDVNENYDIVLKSGGFNNQADETDPVNSPAHYNDGKIEVIEYIEDKKLGFCLGNAIKYISRAGKKDPTKEVEDLKKAIWYVERRIKEINEEV